MERDVLELLGETIGVPCVSAGPIAIEPSAVGVLEADAVRQWGVVPVKREATILWVATCDPFDLTALDKIRAETRLDVKVLLASPSQINAAVEVYRGLEDERARNGDEAK